MLYKKIHRQYVRKWQSKVGKKFKWVDGGDSDVCEITSEPYIDDYNEYISVGCIGKDNLEYDFKLISIELSDPDLGKLWYRWFNNNEVEWLED